MKKSLTLVALSALALTGCDFAGSSESAVVPAASIQVSGLPATNGSSAWDADGTSADVYVEIVNPSGRSVYRSAVQENVASDQLTFEIGEAVQIPFSGMAMHVRVFETDGDVILAQQMAKSESFTLDQVAQGDVQVSDARNGTQIRVVSSAQAPIAE